MFSQLCWTGLGWFAGAAELAAGEVTYPQRAAGYATESCDPPAPLSNNTRPAARHILTRHTRVPSLSILSNVLKTGCSQTSVTDICVLDSAATHAGNRRGFL